MSGTPRAGELRLDGRRVRYRELGAGPPLVIAHGLGLSGRIWAQHLPALAAAGVRAIAPDLPGFGGSAGRARGYDVPETAEWLLAFADALELGAPAWLGHSLAAQATIELAARAPERARALVLASPTGAGGRLRAARQAVGFLRDIGREPVALVPAVAREYLRSTPFTFFGSWLKAARHDPLRVADRVRCPTLIVLGRADPIVPRGYAERLAARMPRARLVLLPGGAHGVVFSRHSGFDRVAAAFVRACAA